MEIIFIGLILKTVILKTGTEFPGITRHKIASSGSGSPYEFMHAIRKKEKYNKNGRAVSKFSA